MVKMITTLAHRFGRPINIKGKSYNIDSEGKIEVSEDMVAHALQVGFELVDKNQKFTSLDEQKKAEDTKQVLETAKAQAKEIIEKAKKEAEAIIAQARQEAGVIQAKKQEADEHREVLMAQTNSELEAILVDAKQDPKSFKGKKKEDLVNMILDLAKPEGAE